jgi:hypothetical protein
MRDRLAVGAAIAVLTLLSYFQFPGHTYLGSDTQIYVPMLERIWDPSVLSRDLVATKPHLTYTLYDEITIALRWITRSSFHAVLVGQQLLFRWCEILGVYLLALSFPLARRMALLVAAMFTLGATIVGPAVLTLEYEPVPRAFAVGLIFLAIGLAAQNHLMLADIAAALAFLYHPPTVWVFWILYLWLVLRHRDYRDLWPLAIGILILIVSSRLQAGAPVAQDFFTRVSPEAEVLERMRAGYNWVTTWSPMLYWQYIFLWIISVAAFRRIQPKSARLFLIAMPAIGIFSIPISYVLLEKLKWGLIPQFQPARALLFVSAFAMILGAGAAVRAAESKRWWESVVWFTAVLAVPSSGRLYQIAWRQVLVGVTLASLLALALYLQRFRWAPIALMAAAILPCFALPWLGQVRNFRLPDPSGLEDLSRYAHTQTPKDAMFLFGDAGQGANPSIFRAGSLRAVYVDWKSGGQMNYRESLGEEWWKRWQETNALRFDGSMLARLPSMDIDYLVLSKEHRLAERSTAYENNQFVVYAVWHGAL